MGPSMKLLALVVSHLRSAQAGARIVVATLAHCRSFASLRIPTSQCEMWGTRFGVLRHSWCSGWQREQPTRLSWRSEMKEHTE
jgi:hypothetical protein